MLSVQCTSRLSDIPHQTRHQQDNCVYPYHLPFHARSMPASLKGDPRAPRHCRSGSQQGSRWAGRWHSRARRR